MDLCDDDSARLVRRGATVSPIEGAGPAIIGAWSAARPTSPGRLGIITSHKSEAACFRPLQGAGMPAVLRSGGSAERARRGAEELRRQGVTGLVSFGLATGLAPVLRPGDLVLAESVVLPSGQAIHTDPVRRGVLAQRMSGLSLRVARIAGRDELPTSASAKRRAFQATFAAALDTDSHAVAEVAAAAGLPFVVIRAVAEPAEQNLPSPLRTQGGEDDLLRGLGIAVRLLCRPWEFPTAWQFARNGRLALGVLRHAAAVLALPETAAA